MKNIYSLLLVFVIIYTQLSTAQVPQKINYQAIARNATGTVISNQAVGLRFTVHDGSATGAVMYRETNTDTTNQFGLFTTVVGGGVPVTNTFDAINWGSGDKYLQVEIDATGGTTYTDMGTTQLLSVPYALNALTSADNYWTANGNDIYKSNTGNVGIGTTSPVAALHITPNTPGYALRIDQGATGHGIMSYVNTNSASQVLLFATSLGSSSGLIVLGNGYTGIGTTSPQTNLHIVSSTNHPVIIDGANGMFVTLAEGGVNRGYIGSFAGNTTDVDFGTFSGNSSGKLLFTIEDDPKMAIDTTGKVGIGTTVPAYNLDVKGNSERAGNFSNTTTGAAVDNYGITGSCTGTTDYGYGVRGDGCYTGVYGEASIGGTNLHVGVDGSGKNGSVNIGVRGYAEGGTTNYGVYATANSANWAGYFGGNVYSSGTYQSSDRKLKNNIKPLSGALAIIGLLNPSVYTFKTEEYKQMNLPEGLQYGLIADEVQQVLPGAVKRAVQPAEYENHNEHTGKKLNDAVEFNAINYTGMIPITISAIQEQQRMIEELKKEIEELKKQK